MTDQVVVLCVSEGWRTAPMGRESAEKLVRAGFKNCNGEHVIEPIAHRGTAKITPCQGDAER